jgi:hypothetical protein
MRAHVMAVSLPSAWAVYEKTPFHLLDLIDLTGALGTAATLGLGANPYSVAGGAAHAISRKGTEATAIIPLT